MPSLDAILDATRRGRPALRARMRELERAAADRPLPPDFGRALRRSSVALIAEVKRRSPSKGWLHEGRDVGQLARAYAEG